MVENALFIQERETGYGDTSIAAILLEFCSLTDGAWMSAKKDNLVNIGGWLAVNDWDTFEELRNLVVVYEGLHTYGGMAGRDMEALAIGIQESVTMRTEPRAVGKVRYRVSSDGWKIPVVKPSAATPSSSTRAPSIRTAQDLFPGQTLRPSCTDRDPLDGAGDRERRAGSGDRGSPLSEAGADPAHDSAARLYAGSHGCGGGVGQGRVRRPRRGAWPQDGLRAEVPALLPGALRATPGMNAEVEGSTAMESGDAGARVARGEVATAEASEPGCADALTRSRSTASTRQAALANQEASSSPRTQPRAAFADSDHLGPRSVT
jgi:hypothetical protein